MSREKTNRNGFHYRMTHKYANYSIKNYWQPGDALNEKDLGLLKVVKDFYQQNGYAPSRGELPQKDMQRLKGRFRTWKNVILAAELPAWNDAEAQKKRIYAAGMKSREA